MFRISKRGMEFKMLNRLNEGQNAQENAFDVDALRRHLSAVSKHSQNTNVNVTDICQTGRLFG